MKKRYLLVFIFSLMSLEGLQASPNAELDKKSQSDAEMLATEARKNPWTIIPWPKSIKLQLPGRGLRTSAKEPNHFPNGTTIVISSGEANLELLHLGGSRLPLQVPGIFQIDESILRRQSNELRTAMDSLPSNLVGPQSGTTNSIENLINFFVPRVPLQQNIPGRINGPGDQSIQPIRPIFPGPVHFIETTQLPVQIGLEWPTGHGQVEPHSVYLWSENRFVHSPAVYSRAGKAKLSLANYGRYFWQIEDASKKFLSIPRTIIVLRPGEKISDDIEEKTTRANKPNKGNEAKRVIGGMTLALPRHRSTFAVCGVSRDSPARIPIRVDVAKDVFSKLEIETYPRFESQSVTIEIDSAEQRVESSINFSNPGNFELVSSLVMKTDNQKIPLSRTQIQIEDLCSNGDDRPKSSMIEKYAENIEEIPRQGVLDFTRLVEAER
ncbi:hypothetical protein EBR21_12765 [bacterium]|nr:hypothetical protein [bacterium]